MELDDKLIRAAKVTFTILEGQEIIEQGQETARCLWNYTRYCALSYNRRLGRTRWKYQVERRNEKGKYAKYPGYFTMQKELKDYWAAHDLASRCFSYTVKDFDIAMRSWFSNLKSNPKARPPRYAEGPRQLTFEVGRNAKSLGDWTYRLTVLGGHISERHAIVKVHARPGLKMRDIKLIRIQPDFERHRNRQRGVVGSGSVVFYTRTEVRTGEGIAAIDLGIVNLAAVAFQDGTSILYSGKGILSSDRRFQKKAARCKPSGWQGKGHKESRQSNRNVAYRVKAGNIRRLAIHNATRSVVDECLQRGVGIIIMGDLKGIREDNGVARDHGKAGNLKLHAWPFAEILRQITYKAEEVGIEIKTVSERNTSKCCHFCGAVGARQPRGLLKCKECGIVINSDVNGAFNILNKVSPIPVLAGIGVGADLPGPPSPSASTMGTGEARLSQIAPTFVAKFDLRNWSIAQTCCNDSPRSQEKQNVATDRIRWSVATGGSRICGL